MANEERVTLTDARRQALLQAAEVVELDTSLPAGPQARLVARLRRMAEETP